MATTTIEVSLGNAASAYAKPLATLLTGAWPADVIGTVPVGSLDLHRVTVDDTTDYAVFVQLGQEPANSDTLIQFVYAEENVAEILSEILLAGPQSQTVTFVATSAGAPVAGVDVRIVGRQVVTGTNGQRSIPLDPGIYQAQPVAPSGFELLDPIEVTVANQPVVVPITLTPIGYPAEEAPFSNVLLPVINGYGQGVPGVTISLEFLAFDAGATPPAVVVPPLAPLTTGVHGLTNAKLLRFGRYRATYSYNGRTKIREFVVPDSGTFQVVEPI